MDLIFDPHHRDPLFNIFEYLDAQDLQSTVRVCRDAKESTNQVWKKFLSDLGYTSASHTSYRFILTLKMAVKSYSNEDVPKSIKQILILKKNPTTPQLKLFLLFIKARDTIIVWTKLPNAKPAPNAFKSVRTSIYKAKSFSSWIKNNSPSLQKIKLLYLHHSQLATLPPEIGHLSGLKTLDLAGNHFTSLPREILSLPQLTVLDVEENKLEILNEEIEQLTKLEKLYLDDSQLTSVPIAIGQLPSLKIQH